jgi:hypothetical protein
MGRYRYVRYESTCKILKYIIIFSLTFLIVFVYVCRPSLLPSPLILSRSWCTNTSTESGAPWRYRHCTMYSTVDCRTTFFIYYTVCSLLYCSPLCNCRSFFLHFLQNTILNITGYKIQRCFANISNTSTIKQFSLHC